MPKDLKPQKSETSAILNIDKLIHEPARLLIMSLLYVVESADFIFTMQQTGLTRGNLSTHMSKLEGAGYLDIEKKFVDKRPMTLLQLTHKGREAFQAYRKNMEKILSEIPDQSFK